MSHSISTRRKASWDCEEKPTKSLQQHTTPEPMHFAWRNGTVLCGAQPTRRTLAYHQWNAGMTRWPEACQACVHIYEHPAAVSVAA